MGAVRERALGVLEREGGGPLWDMLVQHEHQHNETMLQTLQLAAPGTYSPDRAAPAGAAANGQPRGGGRALRDGLSRPTASPTTTSARTTRSTCRRSRSTRRRSPTAPTASSWRTAATRAARCGRDAGWEWRVARRRDAAPLLDRRRRRAALRRGRGDRSRAAGDARVLVRGRRIRALARRAAAHRGRVGEGRQAARRGHRPPRPAGLRARPRRALRGRLLGVDGELVRRLPRLRGVPLPRVLRGLLRRATTACCGERRGPRGRASRARPSATGTSPSGARSSPGSGARDERGRDLRGDGPGCPRGADRAS